MEELVDTTFPRKLTEKELEELKLEEEEEDKMKKQRKMQMKKNENFFNQVKNPKVMYKADVIIFENEHAKKEQKANSLQDNFKKFMKEKTVLNLIN